MLQTKKIEYQDGNILLEGYLAFDDAISGKKPLILIAHDWSGKNNFTCMKAEKLAELGYIGFALDMFGKGVSGKTTDEKMALITPFMQDRTLLLKRIQAAFETAKTVDNVDTKKIGAIGFCFGGLCVLDLARAGTELQGVVSFHGLLNAPEKTGNHPIRAKILELHGHDDPMVKSDQLLAFEQEMTNAKVDWQVHIYGNAMHAFTNPQANDSVLGTVYNQLADRRSWIAMKAFFEEVFENKTSE